MLSRVHAPAHPSAARRSVCGPLRVPCSVICQAGRRQLPRQQAAALAGPAAFARSVGPHRSVSVRSSASAAPSSDTRKLISRTEVPAFIQRDDMMDQMLRWAFIEAGENGLRNFGMPMTVQPFYQGEGDEKMLWGFTVGIVKEGVKQTDIGIQFDGEITRKHEWVGRGDDGMPVLEGKVDEIMGKHFEIWKNDSNPVSEELRSTIRGFCTGLVAAVNRYYSFGSVFVDDAQ